MASSAPCGLRPLPASTPCGLDFGKVIAIYARKHAALRAGCGGSGDRMRCRGSLALLHCNNPNGVEREQQQLLRQHRDALELVRDVDGAAGRLQQVLGQILKRLGNFQAITC